MHFIPRITYHDFLPLSESKDGIKKQRDAHRATTSSFIQNKNVLSFLFWTVNNGLLNLFIEGSLVQDILHNVDVLAHMFPVL